MELEAAISALKPASLSSAYDNSVVLTAIAHFPPPPQWRGNPAREVAAIRDDRWHPTDIDFNAMAQFMTRDNAFGARTHEIVRVKFLGDLLRAMTAMPAGSVGRINILTHANPGSIPFAGEVNDNGDVFLGAPEGDPLNDVSDMDGTTLGNLRAANSVDFGHPDLAFTPTGGGAIKFKDALKHLFPSWAFIYLYGCRGGFDQPFLQNFADTFGVMVFGFGAEVFYAPEVDGNRISNRLRCQYPAKLGPMTIGLHNLKPDRFAKPGIP